MAKDSLLQADVGRDLEPWAATASMFLYTQGNSVVCCSHDTLTVERCLSGHKASISLLAVDTASQNGAGRWVVSYDVEQAAVVWDCMTGDEIAKFQSYDTLTAAAWMRNGCNAFGMTRKTFYRTALTLDRHRQRARYSIRSHYI